MKALSVRQPWASLIAAGIKTAEMRSRRTHYRGEVLICASASDVVSSDGRTAAHKFSLDADRLPRGVAVATVRIIGCRPMTAEDAALACCPFEPGAFVWLLADARPVAPFPVKGRLSLFEVEPPAGPPASASS